MEPSPQTIYQARINILLRRQQYKIFMALQPCSAKKVRKSEVRTADWSD